MMPFFMLGPGWWLIIPAIAFSLWAQWKVKSTYAKYAKVGTQSGLSGAQVAARILRDENIELVNDPSSHPGNEVCGLEAVPGELTDHYDPKARMLRLSQPIYGGQSVAALGIAAHEVGHAIQHARMYSPLMLRNVVYPACNIGSTLAFPLLIIGVLASSTSFGPIMINLAILFFTLAVFFTVITLPVEFNASSRAIRALSSGGYLTDDELRGAKKVLNAAAMTYVAAAAAAILELVRMLLLANAVSRD